MSGGSMDYLYRKVQEAAEWQAERGDARRRAFGRHLLLVAKALHDIEWVDSCDSSAGSEHAAIEKVLGGQCAALVLEEAGNRLRSELDRAHEVLAAFGA